MKNIIIIIRQLRMKRVDDDEIKKMKRENEEREKIKFEYIA